MLECQYLDISLMLLRPDIILQSAKKNVGSLSAVDGQMFPRFPKSMLVSVMSSAAKLMDPSILNDGEWEGGRMVDEEVVSAVIL